MGMCADNGHAQIISHGVLGVPFTSANASAADAAVSDLPATGEKLVITDLVISVDTAMSVSFKGDTGGNVIAGPYYLPANSGPVQITLRGKFKHPTADKKLWVRTSASGNISVDPYYYSEA